MPLPEGMADELLDSAKLVLKVETDIEDTLLAEWITTATAVLERCIGRTITAEQREFTDRAESGRLHADVRRLLVPEYPVDGESVEVTDADDEALDPDTYTVDERAGIIHAKPGTAFCNGPYTILCDVGLEAHPQFDEVLEPLVRGAVLDLVADYYQRRNPAAQAEGAGGGQYTQWQGVSLPRRVAERLQQLRALGWA